MQASLADAATEAVVASRPLVASLVRTLRDMQSEYGLEGGVSVADLVRFPGALERVEDRRAERVGHRQDGGDRLRGGPRS